MTLSSSTGCRMKTLGIIGGIGPESTIEYYRLALAEYRARAPDGGPPPIIINSIDVHRMLALIGEEKLEELTRYLADEVRKLAAAGADLGLLAANSPHIVFEEILRESPIPLVSIVQAAYEAASALRLSRLGLFGTQFTMQGRFYGDVFAKHGIALIAPRSEEQAYIHQKYTGELLQGLILPETRERLRAIARRMKDDEGIQGLILAGTELPLILRGFEEPDLPFLDTTQIHVCAAITRLLTQ